ncbi:sn-glycerol-3-phosphate ABC transporter permease UgpE [Candidimonas nitroreducens]|uniref:sn-glycerol-3-phosphate transport system permease protein UgpE n=1 Tax=Candidimonas nitroreducens TaxID=683354 RepID=A0A225MEQ5_9BURK|nr:sn-glycerol-3-phosphate ABC transporter permease UgpE [Candidimonas nitroreducens]OWT57439.1 ABC transporter permease [Candidimonas nitroreducens]
MVERSPWFDAFCHLMLLLGAIAMCLPLYYAIVASTHSLDDVLKIPMPLMPGKELFDNLQEAIRTPNFARQLFNSLVLALGITIVKIAVSFIAAFAVTYFRFRFRVLAFWLIFSTLMLPVEVRIVPTYELAANVFAPLNWLLGGVLKVHLEWNLLDTYTGLILPLAASATGTFLFRQLFLTVPDELLEAAKIDGAGPIHFARDILWPLSRTNVIALTVILFVFGWNQYLWPMLIITEPNMTTAVVGLAKSLPGVSDSVPHWNTAMARALLISIPPVTIVLILQRWFVKGLVDAEK